MQIEMRKWGEGFFYYYDANKKEYIFVDSNVVNQKMNHEANFRYEIESVEVEVVKEKTFWDFVEVE
jgi:hypothetical protein